MNKFLILLIALSIAITPVFAQDGYDEPAEPAEPTFSVNNPDLSAIQSKINEFIAAAGSDLPADFAGTVSAEVNKIKQQLEQSVVDQATEDKANEIIANLPSDVNTFIDKVKSELAKVDGSNLLGNSEFPNKGDVRKEAVKDFADQVKFVVIDKQDINNPFTQAKDYDRDIESVTERAEIYLKGLNQFDPTQQADNSGGAAFDPLEFLDRGAPLVPQKGFKLEIVSTGLDNRFASFSIFTILNQFRARFAGNSTLTANIDFFLNTLPQSAETVAQDGTSETEDVFDKLADLNTVGDDKLASINEGLTIPLKQNLVNTTLTVNESGEIVTGALANDDPRFNDTNGIPSGSAIDATFNARKFGGNFNDGVFPTLRLTVGGQQFEIRDQKFTSPLVLDMDGDGKLEASNGLWQPHAYSESRGKVVVFDIYGIGFDQIVEWVGVNDGILIVYNGEKEVNGINLFGDAGGFFHGYEKLAAYDENGDNVVSGEELAPISVWQDKNLNAKVEAGEVTSVSDLGITELRIDHKDFVSSFVQNGKEKKMWDWYPCIWEAKKQK